MSKTMTENKNLWKEEEWRLWRVYCAKKKPISDRMIHYKSFVDNDISAKMIGTPENWNITVISEWVERFKPIYDRVPKKDYDNNTLFICNEPLMNKVIFSAFGTLPQLVDYRYIDLFSISDLWHRRNSKNDYFLDDSETIRSWRDINEDVLCTHASGDMVKVDDIPEILQTLSAVRSAMSGRRTKNKNVWIYFEGTIEELRNSRFSLWESFFKRNGLIIDLNPQSEQNDSDIDMYSLY